MESQAKNTLADIIRKRMAVLKLTQDALAKLSGVRQPVISRLNFFS
jgi:predicted transcriptional regulator